MPIDEADKRASVNRLLAEARRRCAACGHNLPNPEGPPDCPECGLRGVPADYRRQVWQAVDSGKWFFSSLWAPLRKRAPGWWWALDRERDFRRSLNRAGLCALIATAMILGCGAVCDGLVVQTSTQYFHTDVSGARIDSGVFIYVTGFGGRFCRYEDHIDEDVYSKGLRAPTTVTTNRLRFEPSWTFLSFCCPIVAWALAAWAGPGLIGLRFRMRRRLPDFARVPRTIIAAANYEAHRLIHMAILVGIGMGIEVFLRYEFLTDSFRSSLPPEYRLGRDLAVVGVAVLTAAGWIGSLLSDRTRQLVRSPWHATGIIVVYGVVLPLLTGAAAVAMVIAVRGEPVMTPF